MKTNDENISACFNFEYKYTTILSQVRDVLRIIDPTSIANNVDDYKTKRDNAIPKQTKMLYHNKIKDIFENADRLYYNLNEKDELFFGINKQDIRDLIKDKETEYNVYEYRRNLKHNRIN